MRDRNILHWLSPANLSQAVREMQRLGRRTERLWQRSPLHQAGLRSLVAEICGSLSQRRSEHSSLTLSSVELEQLVSALLRLEGLSEAPDLRVPAAFVPGYLRDTTKTLASRGRWAQDTSYMSRHFTAFMGATLDSFGLSIDLTASEDAGGHSPFSAPRAAFIPGLPAALEAFILALYHGDLLAAGLLDAVRVDVERNLLAVSGLRADADLVREQRRLVFPSAHPEGEPSQLAEAYLAGTPFSEILSASAEFRLNTSARLEHAVCFAGSGHGKTQLIQSLILEDLHRAAEQRQAVLVIDSQGDLIRRVSRLAKFSPETYPEFAERLLLIDAADVEHPPALNLFGVNLARLTSYGAAARESILNGIIEAYEALFSDLLGAELTQKQGVVFKYLARLMISIPGATIHTLMDIIGDGRSYRPFMEALSGSARQFFETEFFHPSFAATRRQVQRRLWGVMSTPAFERMFAHLENRLDLFDALQNGKIILINTAKDILKSEGSSLFGRFLLKLLAQAALERAAIPEESRVPTMVYVDEAQEYVDDAVETLFSQGRKYGVGLFLCTQTPELFSHQIRSVIFANTSIKLAGGVSAHDARLLADELHTTASVISGTRRLAQTSEFALWVRNRTTHAVKVTTELGRLEAEPMMSESAYRKVIEANRRRVSGGPLAQSMREAETTTVPSPTMADVAPRTARESPPPPRQSPREDRHRKPEDHLAGKGGLQHRYIQHLVKQLAEERGLRAIIEEAVEGGQVDVGLHQGDLSIACEISVTSTPQYEARNLAKCLRAGFVRVWAIAPDARRRKAIKAHAESTLPKGEASRIEFLTTKDVIDALDALSVPAPEQKVVKGYKVKTSRKAVSPSEARDRRSDVARILSQSMRKNGD